MLACFAVRPGRSLQLSYLTKINALCGTTAPVEIARRSVWVSQHSVGSESRKMSRTEKTAFSISFNAFCTICPYSNYSCGVEDAFLAREPNGSRTNTLLNNE